MNHSGAGPSAAIPAIRLPSQNIVRRDTQSSGGTTASREMSVYLEESTNTKRWGRTKRTWGTIIYPPHFFRQPANPVMTVEDMNNHVNRLAYEQVTARFKGVLKKPVKRQPVNAVRSSMYALPSASPSELNTATIGAVPNKVHQQNELLAKALFKPNRTAAKPTPKSTKREEKPIKPALRTRKDSMHTDPGVGKKQSATVKKRATFHGETETLPQAPKPKGVKYAK